MKTRLFALIVLAAALMLSAACGGATPTTAPAVEEVAEAKDEWGEIVVPADSNLKIGVSVALTGNYAVYGQDILNAVNLAVEVYGGELNGWTLEVVGGDDQCEGAPGVTVAEQFSADPYLLGVIGPMCSGSAVPASDVYGASHVLMITPSVTAVAVTARGFENLFRVVANDDLQAKVTVDYLTKELGVESLGIFHDQSIYGEGIAQAVNDKFTAAGDTVTGFEGITRGDTDFSAAISTMLAGNPEAIYFGGMDAEGALLVTQLRAVDFTGVFFGPDGIKSKPSFVDASGGAAEGAFMTFGAVGGATGYDEFEAKFKEQFGDPVAYAPGGYDATMVMLTAAAKVAKVDADGNLVIGRKALADAVRSAPYDGITGHFDFTSTGDLSAVSITVFKVIDGEIVAQKDYKFPE